MTAWKVLEKEYEAGAGSATRNTLSKFLNLSQEDLRYPTLENYLYEFTSRSSLLASHLRAQHKKKNPCSCQCCESREILPEELFITALLKGLHKKYDPVKVIINSLGDDLTLDEAIRQLRTYQESKGLDNNMRRSRGRRDTTTDKAMLGKEKNKPKKKLACFNCGKEHAGGWRKCRAPCGHCGKTGHVKHNCPTNSKSDKKSDKSGKDNNNKQKAFATLTKGMEDLQKEVQELKSQLEKADNDAHEGEEESESYFGYFTKDIPTEMTLPQPVEWGDLNDDSMPDLVTSDDSDADESSDESENDATESTEAHDSMPGLITLNDPESEESPEESENDANERIDTQAPQESPHPTLVTPGPHLVRSTHGLADAPPSREAPYTCEHKEQCNCGRVCGYCLAEHNIQLARCPRCRNPSIRYCSHQCMTDDLFEHMQFCTEEAQQEWELAFEDNGMWNIQSLWDHMGFDHESQE